MTEQTIKETLTTVKYPGFSRDIVSFGLVKEITLQDNLATINLQVQTSDPEIAEEIFKSAQEALTSADDAITYKVNVDIQAPAQSTGNTQSAGAGSKTGIPG